MKWRTLVFPLLACCLSTAGVFSAIPAEAEDASTDFLDDSFYSGTGGDLAINDPLEPLNRVFFQFNDFSYTWVFEPVASGYSKVVPYDFRMIASNFINNLQEPVRSINAVLQGRFNDAGTLLSRFFINTIFGVCGLGDPAATEFDLQPVDATMGETLATWGVGDGLYLVVPLYGASTLRDFSGTLVDGIATPYYIMAAGWEEDAMIYVFKETNATSFRLGQYEQMKELSFDPYVAVRNGFLQYRSRKRERP